MESEAGESERDGSDSGCSDSESGVESRPMRAVIVVVGGLAVVATGLVVASMIVEPAPASGGGGTVQHDSGRKDERAGSDAPVASSGPKINGGVRREAPSGIAPPSPSVGGRSGEEARTQLPSGAAPLASTSPGGGPPELPDAGSREAPPIMDDPGSHDLATRGKDPTTHRGPEPAGGDPCVVPIYYDWVQRRAALTPDDHSRLTVRVTVENFTKAWWLRPDVPGNAFLWAVEGDIDAKRIQHAEGGALSVKLRSVRLGTRELKDLELPLRMSNHPTGGVFGARLLEAFDVTVDYERGVLAFNDCR